MALEADLKFHPSLTFYHLILITSWFNCHHVQLCLWEAPAHRGCHMPQVTPNREPHLEPWPCGSASQPLCVSQEGGQRWSLGGPRELASIVPPHVRGQQEGSGDKTMTSGAPSSFCFYDQNCRGKPIAFEEEIQTQDKHGLVSVIDPFKLKLEGWGGNNTGTFLLLKLWTHVNSKLWVIFYSWERILRHVSSFIVTNLQSSFCGSCC